MKTIDTIVRLHRYAVALMLVLRVSSLTSAPTILAAATIGLDDVQIARAEGIASPLSEFAFMNETNSARRAVGLAPLELNAELVAAAQAKADDMLAQGYWDHFRPSDKKAGWDFLTETGYVYHYAGENLARGFETAHGITEAWLNSPSHRANLLSDKYTEVGFATVKVPNAPAERSLLTVQLFAAP